MEFRNIQHFILVAQQLSFTKAAEHAYISQQALSKSINLLEQELGVPLFDRHARGLSLTPYGNLFLKRCYAIIVSMNDSITELKNLQKSVESTIKIGFTAGTEDAFPLSNIFDFQKLNPSCKISTFYNNDRIIENMLVSGSLDLGIMGALGHISDLDFFPMIKNETRVIVNRNNPLSEKDQVCMSDLSNEIFLYSSTDFYCNSKLVAACNIAGFSPNIGHTSASITFQMELVKANQGIMIAPDHSADGICDPQIKTLRIIDDPYIFHMHLATKKSANLSPLAKDLKEYILDVAQTINENFKKHTSNEP